MRTPRNRCLSCLAVAVAVWALAACESSNVRMSSPADYLKIDCARGTEVYNTHRSCMIKASFNWSDPDGRRHARTAAINGGETVTVVPGVCARLVSAEFTTPVCN